MIAEDRVIGLDVVVIVVVVDVVMVLRKTRCRWEI
jgi:hypothetical protein